MSESHAPSLDGRVFKSVASAESGDVGGGTHFWFDQSGDLIRAAYRGGTVRLGHPVGRHRGNTPDFQYSHVTDDGMTVADHSADRIERLEDGRLRLHENWSWDSKPRSDTSVLGNLTDEECAGLDLSPEAFDG